METVWFCHTPWAMRNVVLFVSLQILFFHFTKDGVLSEGIHVAKSLRSRVHSRSGLAFLCRMRCAKADSDANCLRACSKFSKRGVRRRRSDDSSSTVASTKVTSSTTVGTTLPGMLVDGNIIIVGPDVDLSKYDLKTHDPSKPLPTLPRKILDVINPNPGLPKSCRGAIDQKTDVTPVGPANDTGPVLSVNTTFKRGKGSQWQARVSWKHKSAQTVENVTGYMVMWNSDTYPEDVNCRKLAQNETTMTIRSADDGWRYPDVLYLNVQPIPAIRKTESLQLTRFSPKDLVPSYSVAGWPTRDPPRLIGAVASGIVCGVVLIVFVAVILYKRRTTTGPIDQTSDTTGNNNATAVTSKPSNQPSGEERFLISYFPESEAMVSEVECLCAWLRDQGYDAIVDSMASVEIAALGRDRWITQQIKKAKKILIIISTGYLKLCAEDLEGTAGSASKQRVDVRFVFAEYFKTLSCSKFICIELESCTCKNTAQESDYPWMEHSYKWPRDRDKILHRMNDRNPLQIA